MKRTVIGILIVVLAGLVAAQIPASAPATSPATSQPATFALPTSEAAAIAPVTMPVVSTQYISPTTTFASTGPTTFPSGLATTGPTTSRAYASSMPSTSPYPNRYSSNGYNRDDYRSRRDRSFDRQPMGNMTTPTPPALSAKPLTRSYYLMLERSIFLKGRQSIYLNPDQIRSRLGQSVGSTTLPTQPTEPLNPYATEANLVFNGVSDVNGEWVAFIENTGLNTIAQYHPGDQVAQGKIVNMTLGTIDYAVGPRITHVFIGQNLLGQDVQVITTQPVIATTNPSGEAPANSTPGNLDSVLERMRKRRQQELNGG